MGNTQRMDYQDNQVRLYTSQSNIVVEKLQASGRHCVAETFIREKYEETSHVFLQAYRWYRQQAAEIVERPADAESGIWTFLDVSYLDRSPDAQILQLQVPLEKVVFFRMSDWNKILNLRLLGTEEEQRRYRDKLKTYAVPYEGDVYTTPFYPHLKRELTGSWEKLFQYDEDIKRNKILPFADFQGGLWEIRREWVVSYL